jgi:DNA uptake protein ComE-like DNA-binding protein
VNTADADDLQAVLGVSADASAAIIARRQVRRFTSLADLASVAGIGPSAIEPKRKRIFF